jgi:ethanolamine-phosphate cytidylyltransferase
MDLMNHFKVSIVIHGQTPCDSDVDGRDPYEVPKALGKFQQIDSGNPMSTQDIITRIIDNRFVDLRFHLFELKLFFLL